MEIKLEKLTGHATEAKIVKISVSVGDDVVAGDLLMSLEAGKGPVKVVSSCSGKIEKIHFEAGEKVKIGETLVTIDGKISETPQNIKKGYTFGLSKPAREELRPEIAIIGGGPGGYVAAIKAAKMGAGVVLIERDRLGGTCLNHGCIPTKALVKSAHVYEEMRRSSDFGIVSGDFSVDMAKVISRKDSIVDTLVGGISMLFDSAGVRHIEGTARISPEGVVTVSNSKVDVTIHPEKVIIATGSEPVILPIEGAKLEGVVTSGEILNLKTLPESLTIIGGGIISMEFAFIFRSFGTEVNVIEFMPGILNGIDEEAGSLIQQEAIAHGIRIFTGAEAKRIVKTESGELIVTFVSDGKERYINSEKVLMAVGRCANFGGIDLNALGIELNEQRNGIAVDEYLMTTNPKFYAIGDVTGKIQLAHVASHQGIAAVDHIMGINHPMQYNLVPSAIFTMPEIGVVGKSEKEIQESGKKYRVYKFPLAANGKALTQGDARGFVKLLMDEETKHLEGAVIIGTGATDMLATVTNLIDSKQNIDDMVHTIYAHPTTSESIHEALLGLAGGAIHFA